MQLSEGFLKPSPQRDTELFTYFSLQNSSLEMNKDIVVI